MICATILFCYLFTCCITTVTLSQQQQQQQQLDAAALKSLDNGPPLGPAAHQAAVTPAADAEIIDYVKHNKVHKLMSEQDLRRTFQVDSHDQVPEYEILKLTVNDDGSHLISPISDLGEFVTTEAHSTTSSTHFNNQQSAPPTRTSNATTRTSDQASDSSKNLHPETPRRHKRSPEEENMSISGDGAQSYQQSGGADDDDDDRLIVMNLSTFGQDFRLRLKRNADFQQRIKDMKMFMAESTSDGRLRYTEIENNHRSQGQPPPPPHSHHRQEPHKRAATAEDAEDGTTKTTTTTTAKPSSATRAPQTTHGQKIHQQQRRAGSGGRDNGDASWANIGSTYHDEDNLAALLIDQDSKTGQLQVDGTIGNDFVIKPMPQATIDALLAKRAQELQPPLQQADNERQQVAAASPRLAASNNKAASPSLSANADLERSTSNQAATQVTNNVNDISNKAITNWAQHLHDDDPHDDDEMFLDEDEALEMAHLQSSAQAIESNHTNTVQNQPQSAPAKTPVRKQASERKWRKYRKLMAQTRVPKPAASATSTSSSTTPSSSSTGSAARARRHTGHDGAETRARTVKVSHHIIYRQRPSSEGSSSEHQHSFMASPQPYEPSASSMEQMAFNFRPHRLTKHSAEIAPATATNRHEREAGDYVNLNQEDNQDADFQEDPLGGQFYLEPGLVTGVDRAGFSDWSLLGSGVGYRANGRALPPYAVSGNGTALDDERAPLNGTHTRHKRHAPPPMRGGGPMRARPSQVRRKRQAPDTVWPEVLLVVDYDSFLLHGGDSRDVKRYFVSFWNGVDLRYKLLVHPHIRISLAGMIVAKDRDATPYLERNRLRAPNADAVDAAGALTDMGKYLYREDRLPTYDLAVVITKLDMCRRRYEGGRCNRGTAGFAYVGGACVVNKRLEKVNSVAIIEDSGGFSGIIVAAHEVGHLLGCVHDGSPPPSYLGGPGATHCPWEDGFIMSDLRHTERGFRWSQCSVEQFKHFLNGETATCLYNYPHESQMLHRLLPGTMLSLDDQCKRDRGTNACFKDARVCAQLFCFDSASGYCVSYRPAAEGSPCGEGQVCRNGKCVGEIENIIPDYTHQSQTVIARRPSTHSIGRLADNGLSASSTSMATSALDAGSTTGTNSQLASGSIQQPARNPATSSRRMDTFSVDTPIITGTNQPASSYPFGGRFASSSTTRSLEVGPVTTGVSRNPNRNNLAKSARYLDARSTSSKSPHHSSGVDSASSAPNYGRDYRSVGNGDTTVVYLHRAREG